LRPSSPPVFALAIGLEIVLARRGGKMVSRKIGEVRKEKQDMNIGERIKFSFGGKEKEGMVVKIFPKKVYLKVDFPKHPGKTIVRSLAELEGITAKKSRRKTKAAKEKKAKREKKEPVRSSNEKTGGEEKE
jgi:hypothetical protein